MREQLEKKLQAAINRYLALDPESAYRLQALDGKVLSLRLSAPVFEIQLSFSGTTLYLKTNDFLTPDTLIISTPISLLHLMMAPDPQIFFKEHLSIEGDAELAQKTMELISALEIDWEEHLSHWIGDVPSHQIGRVFHKIKKSGKYFRRTFVENISDYIHEEINLFPPREALEDFFEEIDTLRMDVDRLAVRIEKLAASLERPAATS